LLELEDERLAALGGGELVPRVPADLTGDEEDPRARGREHAVRVALRLAERGRVDSLELHEVTPPPSRLIACPLIPAWPGSQRKTTRRATSSSVIMRPCGLAASNVARACSAESPVFSEIRLAASSVRRVAT